MLERRGDVGNTTAGFSQPTEFLVAHDRSCLGSETLVTAEKPACSENNATILAVVVKILQETFILEKLKGLSKLLLDVVVGRKDLLEVGTKNDLDVLPQTEAWHHIPTPLKPC